MKKIQTKIISRTKVEYNYEGQEQNQIINKKYFKSNENKDKNNYQEKPSNKIVINNPIIQSKRSKNISNYSQNQIQKKYSRYSNENQKNNNNQEGYLDSDLEDSDNKIIYENVIQRMENKEIFQNNPTSYYPRRKYITNDIKDKNKIDDKNKVSNKRVIIGINNDNQRKHRFHLNSNKTETSNVQEYTNKINDKNKNINYNANNNVNNTIKNNINKTINNNKSGYSNKKEENISQKYLNKINEKTNYVNNNANNTINNAINKNKTSYRYLAQKDNNTIIAASRRNIRQDIQKKEEDNKGTSKIRRQTVERGGLYNNHQVTHIIYSKKNLVSDLKETKEADYGNFKPKYSANIASTNISRKDSSGNFKITSKNSLDRLNITPNMPNLGKTESYFHCSEMARRKDANKYINNNNDKNRVDLYQTRNATNIAAIPRSKNNNKIPYYKTDKKENNTKYIYNSNNSDNKGSQKNINYKQKTFNFNNQNNISFNDNKNTKSYNNYNEDIINKSKSGNIIVVNTPIKTFNSNYLKNIGNKNASNTNINNTRYGNYIHNNSHTIKVEDNKNKNNKYSIIPRNLNAENKPLNNQNTQINRDNSKYLQYPYFNKKRESNEKNNTSIEISKEIEENKKSRNIKNNVKIYDNKNKTNNNQRIDKKKEKYIEDNENKQKLNKDFEKWFLIRRYFKIYKNKIKNDKSISEYEKWFKRNCDNNNDVSKTNIINKYLYFIPSINNDKDIIEQMPYDEWFNRNCEKSENIIKKQNKENEKKLLINKFNNILNKEDKNNVKLNNELRKLNNEEQKEILNSLRKSTKNIDKIEKLDSLIDKCDMKQKEEEKKKLIKSAKDKETKNILEKLFNLWDNKENILPKKEKQNKFEELNNLLKNGKIDKFIEELNNLENNDKKDAINYLKMKNKYKSQEIDKLEDLSNRRKRINVLVNILGGKRNKKFSKKEKLKKIVNNLLNLDKKTKKDFVIYMRNTAQEDKEKNEELLSIINELPSEEKEEYDNFDIDKYNYSCSYSNSYEKNLDVSRRNTEEIKEIKSIDSKEGKEKINEGQLADETEDFKLLGDDIFEIVNEIQNTQENQKKKLAEDEFKNVSDNILLSLYVNKINEEDDYDENDEDLKAIVNSLNNMNKEDRKKTVDILEINADDETKKKRLSLLKGRMKSIVNAKKIIKNIIDKQEEEERKFEDMADSILGQLESNSTIYLNNSNDNSIQMNNKSKEEEKINKVTNMIKSMEMNEQNLLFDKFRFSAKNFGQKNKFYRLFKTTKMINKIKNLRKSDKNWLNNNKSFNQNNSKNESSKLILEEKLKEIIRNFENDLYEEKEKPLSRKEIRENEEENNAKLKEISKAIHSMNEEDQNIVLERLRIKANDEYKKSQFIKLFKLLKNIKNVKSFVDNVAKRDFNMINIEENKKALSKSELEEIKNKLIDKLFKNNKNSNKSSYENIEDDNLEKMAGMIKSLNKNQQNQLLNSVQSKIDSKENEGKFNKLIKKIQYLNKVKNLAKSFNFEKSNNKENIIKNKEISPINENESKIELNEEELVNLIEAIINNLFYKTKKENEMNNVYLSEADEYLIKKEKEKKLEYTAKVLNKLPKNNREMISGILALILDNDEQIKDLNLLNKKIGIYKFSEKGENIINIIEDFKNDDSIEELKDDNLAELTEQLITDLLKDYSLDDNNEKMEKLNKSANIISMMNIKDQEKILEALNNFAKTENQKETMEKLNRLIDNLNYMHFYLYNVNRQHLDKNKIINKGPKNEDFKNLKKTIISQIFNEDELIYDISKNRNKNMSRIALKLSNLSTKNQNNILSEINKKKSEYENNKDVLKSIDELKENLKIIKMGNILSSIFDKKKAQKKKNLGDNQIKLLANNINDVLSKDTSSGNFTEQLLFNRHKQSKIDQFANSLQNYDEETKRKTINYLTKSVMNDINKKEINKLTNSIMNKNNRNEDNNNTSILTKQYYINSLEQTELNEEELNLLIETFFKDLFTDEIQDINKKEENINLIANIIKELNNENQIKVLEKLSKKPEAKNKLDLIENLEETVTKLRVLKDELNDEKKDKDLIDPNKSVLFNRSNEDILENEDDSEESITVEISIDDIEQDEINELCQVFTVDYIDNKSNKKEEKKNQIEKSKSINILAKSLFKFDNKAQKKITDKLEENCKTKNEKEEIKLLKERINQLNTYKKYGKEIINKKKGDNQVFEEEIKNIERENDNSKKNLDNYKLEKLEKEIINNLYNKESVDFNKNEEIKKYLLESQKELKIKKSAEKIISLAIDDKKKILDKLENCANNEKKKDIYNKLFKTIENLEKRKKLKDKLRIKEKQIELQDNNNINCTLLSIDKLEILSQQLEKELFDENIENYINNYISYKIAEKIVKLDENNQESILKYLKEKADNEEKQNRLRELSSLLGKLNNLKKFTQKVREMHINKIALEKMENEKKYGIVILQNEEKEDKPGTILMKKPEELNEDKLNEITNILIEDLNKINEEENDNPNIPYIEKYLKDKENEKILEKIAYVIISLDNNDKTQIIEEIKKNFDNPKINNLYNKFMKIFSKKERQFDNEKRKKKKEAIKEIEKDKKDNSLYSFIKEGNESIFDLDINKEENISNNYEPKEANKWTHKKGSLETEEIY